MSDFWGADCPISLPSIPDQDDQAYVDFGGFGFASTGMVHNLTEAEIEEPLFRPPEQVEDAEGS